MSLGEHAQPLTTASRMSFAIVGTSFTEEAIGSAFTSLLSKVTARRHSSELLTHTTGPASHLTIVSSIDGLEALAEPSKYDASGRQVDARCHGGRCKHDHDHSLAIAPFDDSTFFAGEAGVMKRTSTLDPAPEEFGFLSHLRAAEGVVGFANNLTLKFSQTTGTVRVE
eukprot:scaffold2534_cov364-Prasinococcus_capsulatus_cf.AAC.4